MTRQTIDCRDIDDGCTVSVAANTQEQLLNAAAQHAVHSHGYADGNDLRGKLVDLVKSG
jgi:predicted small metal-binding protein